MIRRPPKLLSSLALIAGLLSSRPARADDTHYQDFLIGTRSVGLGGAFAGLADDPSGLWLNPAGLVFADRSNLSVSTSFYGFEFNRLDLGLAERRSSVSEQSFDFVDDLRVIPATFGGVIGLGKKRPDRTYTHSIAFLFAFPAHSQVTQRRSLTTPFGSGDQQVYFERTVTDYTFVAGGGYAYRARDWLSLGFAAFYLTRNLDHENRVGFRRLPSPGDVMEFEENQVRLMHSSASLLFNLGARFQLSKRWSLGVSLHLPTIPLTGESELVVNELGSRRDAAGNLVNQSDRRRFVDKDVRTQFPLHLRVGAAMVVPSTCTLTLDVSLYTPVEYRLFRSDPEITPYLPVPPFVQRRATGNVSLGFEYLFIKRLSLAVGAFTNLSSASSVPESPTREMLPRIHQFGATLAIGYFIKHSLLRLGVAAAYGRGHDVVAVEADGLPGPDSTGYARIGVDRLYVHVYLASTFRY